MVRALSLYSAAASLPALVRVSIIGCDGCRRRFYVFRSSEASTVTLAEERAYFEQLKASETFHR